MATPFLLRIVRSTALALGLILLLWLWLAHASPAAAGGIVMTCDEAHLRAALAGGGAITFSCGSTPPITLTDQILMTTTTSLDGSNGGYPVTLSGGNTTRLLVVNVGTAVVLNHLTLRDGNISGGPGGCISNYGPLTLNDVTVTNCFAGTGALGGALYVDNGGSARIVNSRVTENSAGNSGGGVYSLGALTLSNSYFAHNSAGTNDGGGIWVIGNTRIDGSTFYSNTANGYGGGIYNQGTLSMTNSALNANLAVQGGGGIQTYLGSTDVRNVMITDNRVSVPTTTVSGRTGGGMLLYQAVVTLTNVTLSGNSAYDGGGMDNFQGKVTLNNSTLSDNSASDGGGGIASLEGEVTLNNVTLSGNSAVNGNSGVSGGGAIFNVFNKATLNNVTLSGNSTPFGYGGGINNDQGEVSLTNVTLSGNSAYGGGGIDNEQGRGTLLNVTLSGNSASWQGGGLYGVGTFTQYISLTNTIVANSPSGGNCDQVLKVYEPFMSIDYNLSSDNTCHDFDGFVQPHDLNGVDPHLGPLANNGGPTLTHLPQPGSPAINHGSNAACPPFDQRGVQRPQGGVCDIGAVEVIELFLPLIVR